MNALKKQGVAWLIAIVMIVVAIGIGQAKAPVDKIPISPAPDYPQSGVTQTAFYVYDDANVLSSNTEEKLSARNQTLYQKLDVRIAVVTCNYGGDLFNYALEYGDRIGLGGNDFIVMLDISGENYWLVQGSNLIGQFTDEDCGDYAWHYMESDFAVGDYDGAVLALTEALEAWYYEMY